MKNNKRSPLTIARQAAFAAGLGIPVGISLKNALVGELGALAALSSELIGQEKMTVPGITMPNGEPLGFDKPVARVAMESTAQGNRENSPELYGRTLRQTRQKYAGEILACHSQSSPCDVETSEVESVLLASVSNVNMGEANEATKD